MARFIFIALCLMLAFVQTDVMPRVILRQGESEPYQFYEVHGTDQILVDYTDSSPTPSALEARVGIYEMTWVLVDPLYGPYVVHDAPPIYGISSPDML